MQDIASIVDRQRAFFLTGATLPVAYRRDALARLQNAILTREGDIYDALMQDLRKPEGESFATEVGIVRGELRHALRHIRRWAKPRRAPTSLALFPARCYAMPEPYGTALILSPWNYPFMLTMAPLVGAIAAGNTAVVKPSAYSAATSELIADMIADAFPPEYIAVVTGGRAQNAALFEQRFDYLFFTGSAAVGRLAMQAAAQHLTPVTLELGGKSPTIVDATADIELAAKRLAFGKFLNAGQTCVAPDYVLVARECRDALVRALSRWIEAFYPRGDRGDIVDYPRIVNRKHFDRLRGLLDGQRIAYGGACDESTLTIEPTLLVDVDPHSAVMSEEIFGPILPILTYDDPAAMLRALKALPQPLALYLFTRDDAWKRRVLAEVSFGGGCVNDTVLHVATSHLAFGGVGESGMGRYHGRASFDTFSHSKSIVEKAAWPDFAARYRPHDAKKTAFLRRIL